jgi:hypothetical protein
MESVRHSRFDEGEHTVRRQASSSLSARAARSCRAKFRRYYPKGFVDADYLDLERGYKWAAHERWKSELPRKTLEQLIENGRHKEVAARAVAIESRTNLLFSFEKMALRDAVKSPSGARAFAEGLHGFLYGRASMEARFNDWIHAVGRLPRRQTRVLTWPVLTVMGFLAQPSVHMYLKPTVTRKAAERYRFDFHYESRPTWATYSSLLKFARTVRADLDDMNPRDMVDIQSFIWVQGSDEYPD